MESGSSFGGGVAMCDASNSSVQLAIGVGCATVDTWNSGKHFEVISINSLTYHYTRGLFSNNFVLPQANI